MIVQLLLLACNGCSNAMPVGKTPLPTNEGDDTAWAIDDQRLLVALGLLHQAKKYQSSQSLLPF
jgi:hypothetical protein